ncbi:MAG: hypothetical protein ACI398_00375 [Clostridium sp.]
MKIKKSILSLMIVAAATCSIASTNVYASTSLDQVKSVNTISAYSSSNEKTVTANKPMSLALNPGQTGYSNQISFNFKSLPSNAIVKSIEVDAGSGSKIGSGLGAIMPNYILVTNPENETKQSTWGRGNVTNVSGFTADKASGTWYVSYCGTNIASASSGSRFVGGVKYPNVKMTIKYILE